MYILTNMFSRQTTEAIAGIGFICLGAAVYFGLGLGKATVKGEESGG